MSRGETHWWLRAGLLARGFTLPVASMIATRHLYGGTLFPVETDAALAVLATLPERR